MICSNKPTEHVLSSEDMKALFLAKISDLRIQFFQNQYTRFVDYCEKYCTNRILNLVDVSLWS